MSGNIAENPAQLCRTLLFANAFGPKDAQRRAEARHLHPGARRAGTEGQHRPVGAVEQLSSDTPLATSLSLAPL